MLPAWLAAQYALKLTFPNISSFLIIAKMGGQETPPESLQHDDHPIDEEACFLPPYHDTGETQPNGPTRTRGEMLIYIISSDQLRHSLFMLLLFIATTAVWCHEELVEMLKQGSDPWVSVYDGACDNLLLQIFIFLGLHVIRCFEAANEAVKNESGIWVRQEESYSFRMWFIGLVWADIVASVVYIFIQHPMTGVRVMHRPPVRWSTAMSAYKTSRPR